MFMSSRNIGRGDLAGRRRNGTRRQASSPAKSTPPAKVVAEPAGGTTFPNLDRDADRLAASLEQALAEGHADALAPAAVQRLMAAICRAYRAQIDAGRTICRWRGIPRLRLPMSWWPAVLSFARRILGCSNLVSGRASPDDDVGVSESLEKPKWNQST